MPTHAVPDTTDHDAVDDDRAVDQLVDELSARIHHLRCLLSGRDDTSPWPDDGIRRGATQAVGRLRLDRSRRTAEAVVETLWPARDLRDLDDDWVATPLGRLLVDVMTPARRE